MGCRECCEIYTMNKNGDGDGQRCDRRNLLLSPFTPASAFLRLESGETSSAERSPIEYIALDHPESLFFVPRPLFIGKTVRGPCLFPTTKQR